MHVMTKYGFLDTAPAGVPPSRAGLVSAQRGLYERVLDDFDREIKAISANTNLSESGRAAALGAAGRRVQAALESAIAARLPGGDSVAELKAGTATYRAAIAAEQRKLPTPVSEGREREIRAVLLALPPGERLALALQAAAADDRETLQAIRNALRIAPVLTSEQLAAVDRAHLERHFAAEVAALAGREALDEALDTNVFLAQRAVRGEGRLTVPPAARPDAAPASPDPTPSPMVVGG